MDGWFGYSSTILLIASMTDKIENRGEKKQQCSMNMQGHIIRLYYDRALISAITCVFLEQGRKSYTNFK